MGYYELDKEKIKKISEITYTDYGVVYEKFLKLEDIDFLIDDLLIAYDKKCEELEEIIQERNDNWRRLGADELYEW